MLKRAYKGIFHKLRPKHLDRCVREFMMKRNQREIDTVDIMGARVDGGVGKRLRYEELIADSGLSSGAQGRWNHRKGKENDMAKTLLDARKRKNDEFCTQLTDIEKELRHYRPHFEGKAVYCNCDDPRVSNFFHYFSYNFRKLNLRKLVTTCYQNQDPDLFSRHDSKRAIKLEYDGFREGDSIPRPEDIGIKRLEGDGDFRSPECADLLRQADIVVTNPPFSLFREYVGQLVEHGKKFLILGSQNAVTYKEFFRLIQENKVWLGVNNGGKKWFQVNPEYEIKTDSRKKWEHGKKYFSMGNINWFTNLDFPQRHADMLLHRRYVPEEYPKYDGYDVINVDRTADIPADYEGVMGVPITFLDKYNPDQFEILGMANSARWLGHECYTVLNGRKTFNRVLIRRKR